MRVTRTGPMGMPDPPILMRRASSFSISKWNSASRSASSSVKTLLVPSLSAALSVVAVEWLCAISGAPGGVATPTAGVESPVPPPSFCFCGDRECERECEWVIRNSECVVPEEPGGWTAPEVTPSVSSSGRRVVLMGGGTTMSVSRGEGGMTGLGGMEKPAAMGREESRSSTDMGGGVVGAGGGAWSCWRGRGCTGESGWVTQGTTRVTTLERKEGRYLARPGVGFMSVEEEGGLRR